MENESEIKAIFPGGKTSIYSIFGGRGTGVI